MTGRSGDVARDWREIDLLLADHGRAVIAALGLHHFHALEIELEVVAQPAVEDAGSGAGRPRATAPLAIAGHAQHRAGHGIEHVFPVRVGDDDPVRIDRRHRIDRKVLHLAIGQHQADGFGFFYVMWSRYRRSRTSAPLTTRPWLAPEPLPPENAFNSPAVPPWLEAENVSSPISMVHAPLPTAIPASVASYCASSRPWGGGRLRREREQAATHRPKTSRDFGRNGACGGHVMQVPGSARANVI